MKKIVIATGIALFVGAIFYANHQFGLLSWAGLNDKGLPTKKVQGSLASFTESSAIIDHSKWTALLKLCY